MLRTCFLLIVNCCWMASTLRILPSTIELATTQQPEVFQNTVLVLQGVREDRMELMNEVYQKWFGAVKFMVWEHSGVKSGADVSLFAKQTGRSEEEVADEISNVRETSYIESIKNDQIISCDLKTRATYHNNCLSLFLKTLISERNNFTGVLSMHMDLWVNPIALMRGSNLNQVWQLGAGLSHANGRLVGPLCFRNETELLQNRDWYWWFNSKITGLDALQKLKLALQENPNLLSKSVPMDDLETCAGWSDLFYLPKSIWQDFRTLSEIYGNVFHEVALPTMFSHLSKIGNEVSFKQCEGGCCRSSNPNKDNPCGHRIDLAQESKRNDLKNFMNGLHSEYMSCGLACDN